MSPGTIRVVIAEDGVLLREGLAGLLARFGFDTVTAAGDAEALRSAVGRARSRPGDHRHPHATQLHRRGDARGGGAAAGPTPGWRSSCSASTSSTAGPRPTRHRRRPGRRLPAQGPGGRRRGVRRRAAPGRRRRNGGRPQVVSRLLRRRRDPLPALSPREREVLALIAEGHSNAAIARHLVISEPAVGKHVRSILAKLQLPQTEDTNRRVLAVLAYLRNAPGPHATS